MTEKDQQAQTEMIRRFLDQADSLAVLTGAGVSAESGIPTFRDAQTGLWAKYDPMELATPEAFARDPALVSRWYDERRRRCAECEPNPGHLALARLQDELEAAGKRFTLITQNVDRLHQRAGSRDPLELHGTFWIWRCTSCGEEREERAIPLPEYPPRCRCGGARRPGVVWFGEALSESVLAAARRAAEHCELFMSLGTSSLVEPAASLGRIASSAGAKTVEINPQETPLSSRVDISVRGATGEILPLILPAQG
ncbi:MAG: NAD-dependent deacylase [Chromatiaceae bacterium]|nr:NAD-dependent deacylase [Chromatiaceae bacterium]